MLLANTAESRILYPLLVQRTVMMAARAAVTKPMLPHAASTLKICRSASIQSNLANAMVMATVFQVSAGNVHMIHLHIPPHFDSVALDAPCF